MSEVKQENGARTETMPKDGAEKDKEEEEDEEEEAQTDGADVLDCYGRSEVVGRTRSGRTVRTPARYVPTMDNTPYGCLDLKELDPEELAAMEDGDTSEITSIGEEEEQDEKELDEQLANEKPNEIDKSFIAPKKPNAKRKKAEDAWEEPEDAEYVPTAEEVKQDEEEEEEEEEEMEEEDEDEDEEEEESSAENSTEDEEDEEEDDDEDDKEKEKGQAKSS
jgi:hypothetical protein